MTTKRQAGKGREPKPESKGKAKGKAKAKSQLPANRTSRAAFSVATSARKSVEDRVQAMAEVPLALCDTDENLQAVLDVLRDRQEASEVRLAALQALQAASFSVIAFEPCRADYIAVLRQVADDPDPELRQRVLGILARENDGFAQQKLLEGLEDPAKALVSPEKALQLLSYDAHAEAYSAARAIIDQPPNTAAKREALRLLASDATAAPVFEKILRDKDELPEIRQVSASALQAVMPERLQEHAREIVLDTSESSEIQAMGLTVLTHLGSGADFAARAADNALLKRVDRLSNASEDDLKASALQFLNKYSR
jgi:hypothetical protein